VTGWQDRYEAYRESPGHAAGDDLDLVVEWCRPGRGVTALDVATGGGHVADSLRAAGCQVTTCDQEPAMRPDVVCPADRMSFADQAFDTVVCRIAGHHFPDAAAAVREMARVCRQRLVIEDTLYHSQAHEQAERLRDPSHVRSLAAAEWEALIEAAGLRTERLVVLAKRHEVDAWLARAGCAGPAAQRVRELIADATADGVYTDRKLILLAVRPDA
jgi:SAM-dependent methyltransferase